MPRDENDLAWALGVLRHVSRRLQAGAAPDELPSLATCLIDPAIALIEKERVRIAALAPK